MKKAKSLKVCGKEMTRNCFLKDFALEHGYHLGSCLDKNNVGHMVLVKNEPDGQPQKAVLIGEETAALFKTKVHLLPDWVTCFTDRTEMMALLKNAINVF